MADFPTSFDKDDLLKCAAGELFGPGNAQLPAPPMLMMDRITEISLDGGEFGKGHVIGEYDVKPDLWFSQCHFPGDPVMPGCLGLDAMWQAVGYWLGWSGSPGKGRALGVGEVREHTGQPQARALADAPKQPWENLGRTTAAAHPRVDLEVDGDLDPEPFPDALDAPPTPGKTHVRLWDSRQDLPGRRVRGVVIRLRCRDGQAAQARLLVGADGQHSLVRKRAGIGVEARGYGEQGLVAVVRPDQGHGAVARQVFTPQGALGLLPLADGAISLVWSLPRGEAARLRAAPPEEFCAALAAATGQSAFTLQSERVSFPLQLQHARAYAADGVALIGDAAHVVHPLAGLGMNLGFLDAAALIETLGPRPDAGRHWADWPVLRRYSRRRRAAVVPAVAMIDGLHSLFAPGQKSALAGAGLTLTDRLSPLKQTLARYALGV